MLVESGIVWAWKESNRSFPPIRSRAEVIRYDRVRYRNRNRIERFFNKIKHFRPIATRYDKLADAFFSALYLVAAFVIAKNS